MFYEVRPEVILGGGSAYFLPQGTPGSKRKDSTNYLELFQKDGYKFVSDRTELLAAVDGKAPQKLLTPATWTAGSTATSGRATR